MGRGANEFGQVRVGPDEFVREPQRIQLPGGKTTAVATGGRHSLALDDAGKLWAWGDNSSGQLGLGTTRPASGPAIILGLPSKIVTISAGAQHSAALLADGSVWVWGANNRGQLGQGGIDAFAVEPKPTRVTGLPHALGLAAGNDFVMVRTGKNDKINKTNAAASVIWGWGAGNGSPHLLDKVQTVAALRAHPALRPEAPEVLAAKPQATPDKPVVVVSASAPVPVAPPVMTPVPAVAPAAVSVAPVPAVATVTPTPVTPPAPAPVKLNVSGTVRLAQAPLENVLVTAEGAQCTASDKQGRFVCHVPAGWSGRVRLTRNNYRFSPSALTYQNLHSDAEQQDFAAIYDPR